MPHFLISKNDIEQDIISVTDNDLLRHLSCALRIREGEYVKFIDEDEIVHSARILTVGKKNLIAKVEKSEKSNRKLNFKIYLAISVLKGDALSLAISNAVQTGVCGIFLVISDNCAVKPPKDIEKLQKIADESFKQCERADRAKIFNVDKMENVISKFKNVIIFAERSANIKLKDALKNYDKNEDLLVVIGPEGGFSKREFDYFEEKKYNMVSLGNLIYKAPNAVVAGVSNIVYEMNQ